MRMPIVEHRLDAAANAIPTRCSGLMPPSRSSEAMKPESICIVPFIELLLMFMGCAAARRPRLLQRPNSPKLRGRPGLWRSFLKPVPHPNAFVVLKSLAFVYWLSSKFLYIGAPHLRAAHASDLTGTRCENLSRILL